MFLFTASAAHLLLQTVCRKWCEMLQNINQRLQSAETLQKYILYAWPITYGHIYCSMTSHERNVIISILRAIKDSVNSGEFAIVPNLMGNQWKVAWFESESSMQHSQKKRYKAVSGAVPKDKS